MRRILMLAALALGSWTALVQAQTPTATAAPTAPATLRGPLGYQHYTKAELDKLMFRPGQTRSYVTNGQDDFRVEYVDRGLIENYIENHIHWVDIVTVIEGEGTLSYGGTAVKPDMANPAEPRGTTMTGATTIPLRPGDHVLIPAGMWHIFSGTATRNIRYVIFKQRE
jgi:quercetin dioxygenase-like cupin family protein